MCPATHIIHVIQYSFAVAIETNQSVISNAGRMVQDLDRSRDRNFAVAPSETSIHRVPGRIYEYSFGRIVIICWQIIDISENMFSVVLCISLAFSCPKPDEMGGEKTACFWLANVYVRLKMVYQKLPEVKYVFANIECIEFVHTIYSGGPRKLYYFHNSNLFHSVMVWTNEILTFSIIKTVRFLSEHTFFLSSFFFSLVFVAIPVYTWNIVATIPWHFGRFQSTVISCTYWIGMREKCIYALFIFLFFFYLQQQQQKFCDKSKRFEYTAAYIVCVCVCVWLFDMSDFWIIERK